MPGKRAPYWTWLVAGYCVAVAIWLSIIGKPGYVNQADAQNAATAATVAASVRRGGARHPVPLLHVPCGRTVWDGIATAPKGIHLDTPDGDRPARGDHPCPKRADPRYAAQQHHRDDDG